MSPSYEVTNNRPPNYGRFRREKLQDGICYQTDGDWFEQRFRNNKLVAIAYIETIQIPTGSIPESYEVWDSKKALLTDIKNKMQIPCFVVWHYPDCNIFFVNKWGTDRVLKMNQTQYINFIKKLR